MSHRESVPGEFIEKSTPKIKSVIRDDAGVGIPGGALTTLILTLYEELTGNLLGSRPAGQDILGVNGGSVDVNGNFALQLALADMAILDDIRRSEVHIALIEWTYGAGLGNKKEIEFVVINLAKVA